MSLNFDPIYLIWLMVALSAGLAAEAIYIVCASATKYRSRINHRLMMLQEHTDREAVYIELRRQRGLTSQGDFQLGFAALNKLILQSGLTLGLKKLAMIVVAGSIAAFLVTLLFREGIVEAGVVGFLCATVLPYLALRMLRGRRLKKFEGQFPDALDIIIRSLRAGHPVPVAVSMVGQEMKDPIGSEFGIVSDEITYGADLETAMRNLYGRIGSDDLPLFVTAVAIQSSTGGNLGEILQNLSNVIRQRFKMRRKIRALASEGRASAIILTSLPIGVFLIIQFISPDFYAAVWNEPLTKELLGGALVWMGLGDLIMHRMVNFKI
jgi:tight adherence protein B